MAIEYEIDTANGIVILPRWTEQGALISGRHGSVARHHATWPQMILPASTATAYLVGALAAYWTIDRVVSIV